MSGMDLGTLSIAVVSEGNTSIDNAFVSVTSDRTVSHRRSDSESVSFSPESDSLVTVTVYHDEFQPQTKVIRLSSNRLKQRIRLPERTVGRDPASVQDTASGKLDFDRKKIGVEEAAEELESIAENPDDPRSVYRHVLRAHQSLCSALQFLDRTVAEGSVERETVDDDANAIAADIEVLERYADLLAVNLDVLAAVFDSKEANEGDRRSDLPESETAQIRDLLADFGELPDVKNAVGSSGESLSRFQSWIKERASEFEDSRPSRDELLADVERLADELERVPSHDDVRSNGRYSLNTYYDRFGSWADVIEATDIDQREIFSNDVQAVSDELGEEPTAAEYDVHGEYSTTRLKREFETWSSALDHARSSTADDCGEGEGDSTDSKTEDSSAKTDDSENSAVTTTADDGQRAEMLSLIVDLHDELGRVPKATDLPEDGSFDRQDYLDQFGGWYEAIEKTDLDYRAEILEDIRNVASELGHPPNTVEMNDHGRYDHNDAYRFFDTWDDAMEAAIEDLNDAGITGDEPATDSDRPATDSDEPSYTEERLKYMLSIIVDLYDELGRVPKASHLSDDAPVTPQDYVDQFGGWYEAVELAGLDHREEVLQEIRDVTDELGSPPTTSELSEHGHYDAGDVYHYFDAWSEAKEAAGVAELTDDEPNGHGTATGGGTEDDAISAVETEAERELVEAVRFVARKLGRSPSLNDLSEYSQYDFPDVYDRFDSWEELKELASVEQLPDGDAVPESADGTRETKVPPSELAELYEVFRRLSGTVDAVIQATDESARESPMTEWRDTLDQFVRDGLDDWENGYGPQQGDRSGINIQEYRNVYGDGENVTDFREIETAVLDPVVEAVLDRIDIDERVESLRLPVAPDSGTALPLFVESDRERESAEALLSEFPETPSIDDWEWVSGGSEREQDETREGDAGGEDSVDTTVPEELLDVSGVTESEADSLYAAGFESVEDLRGATIDEISETPGISSQLALRIKADVGGR